MWDPGKYLDYADLRARPFRELVSRVGSTSPRRVADLGCGPGNLTLTLAKRWPGAIIEASDGSPEMVEAARAAGVDAHRLDVRDWTPADDTDVVISNAVLHWVPEHRDLLRRWARTLPAGAWIAIEVPGNHIAPAHILARRLAEQWASELGGVTLRGNDSVDDAQGYADLFTDAGCTVDAWETTYIQRLTGPGAVLEWISGSTLRPIRAALSDESWARFRDTLKPLLDRAYPPRADGTTWFPFRRIFAVAQVA